MALNKRGFTLLEVVIALTIMVLAFASILAVESNSLNATTRAREMNIVAMLARNQMIETEYKIEGKTFDEVKKDDGGAFPPPYQNYRWQTKIKEIEFPQLTAGGGKQGAGDDTGQNQFAEQITRLVTNYLSKAIREVTVTIFWKRGSGEVNYTLSTYWVDLNHEFQTTE